jgi:hypothetical protein
LVFRVDSYLQFFRPKSCMHSHLSHAWYTLRPFYPPWFDHPNNILWKRTSFEALHYAFFSTLPPLPPS